MLSCGTMRARNSPKHTSIHRCNLGISIGLSLSLTTCPTTLFSTPRSNSSRDGTIPRSCCIHFARPTPLVLLYQCSYPPCQNTRNEAPPPPCTPEPLLFDDRPRAVLLTELPYALSKMCSKRQKLIAQSFPPKLSITVFWSDGSTKYGMKQRSIHRDNANMLLLALHGHYSCNLSERKRDDLGRINEAAWVMLGLRPEKRSD